jgi:hydrogenase/urease accessory protein HupE
MDYKGVFFESSSSNKAFNPPKNKITCCLKTSTETTMFNKLLLLTFLFSSLLFCSNTAVAHTSESSKAQLFLLENNKYAITLTIDVLHLLQLEQKIAGDDAQVIEQLKSLSLRESQALLTRFKATLSKQTEIVFDGKAESVGALSGLAIAQLRRVMQPITSASEYNEQLYAVGSIPKGTKDIQLRFSELLGNVVLTVSRPSKSLISANTLSQKIKLKHSQDVRQENSHLSIFLNYGYQGFIHIIPKGLDHILFVLALFLLATKTSTLLWQVSAFTLAHTITLALGIFGLINLPSSIIEPLIALSIAYVAIENIYRQKLTKWRLPIIFAFGLLHGLGFASVLVELGLPESEYVSSLISFNIGVELGQITVLVLALLATFWCIKKPWYRQYVVIPASVIISAIAIYWFIERRF